MLTLEDNAKLCELIYKDNAAFHIERDFPGVFDDIFEYETENKHVKAIVLTQLSKKRCTVIFKGFDWYPGGFLKLLSFVPGKKKMHPGLLDDFQAINEDLRQCLDFLSDECPNVDAAGHSWGGALAVLLATQIDIQSLTTFGQPRIGSSRAVKESLKADHYIRVISAGDWLTSMPFGFGYGHHQKELLMLTHMRHGFHEVLFNPRPWTRVMSHISHLSHGISKNHASRTYRIRMRVR